VNGTSLEARKTSNPPDFWKDPFGQISKGNFSILIHSGNLDFYSEFGSDWYTWSERVHPCDLSDVTPYPVSGWKAVIAADPDVHLHHPFWIHPGNQCGGAHTKGEQLDNVSTPAPIMNIRELANASQTWIWYGPALAPSTNHINVITDSRCQSVGVHDGPDWPIDLAFRCVFPMYDKGEGPHDF
jgi:hypothetical protein